MATLLCFAILGILPLSALGVRPGLNGRWVHHKSQEVGRRYVPSQLEEAWFKLAEGWKQNGNLGLANLTQFCDAQLASLPDIERALALTASLMKSGSMVSHDPEADKFLSHFQIEYANYTHRAVTKQHIEPLVAGLRHPLSVQCNRPGSRSVIDMGYILLAAASGQHSTRSNILLDAGAGVGYNGHADQHWLIHMYEQRGLPLDLMVYWEAQQANPQDVYNGVPRKYFPNFVYYNIPAPADLADDGNPLNMMARIAKPEDFVSLKIDIDAPATEAAWLGAISNNAIPYAHLIDELFFEHHFNFKFMNDCCWRTHSDVRAELIDSMRLFRRLRELGIRAHYWP